MNRKEAITLTRRAFKNVKAVSPRDPGYDEMAKAIQHLMVANKHLMQSKTKEGKYYGKKLTMLLRELDMYMG